MKWKIKIMEALLSMKTKKCPDNADSLHKALIKYAPEMFDEIMDITQSLDSTKKILRKPKKHYDRLERILELINETNG